MTAVERPRDIALEEIDELLAAARRLRADLRAKEAVYRQVSRQLRRGTAVSATMQESGASTMRQELTDALDEFERCRHRTRLALTRAGLDEGMTIGELGRAWGFSRQLAARYAREAEEEARGVGGAR
jgi:hypothetical protein